MHALTCLVLGALLPLGPAAAQDFDRNHPNPLGNLRPENVTGLPYWLYAWVGSYYNGTTRFRFSPQESIRERESVCDMFANRTLTFSFPSLVAVTKPDGTNEDEDNPVMFLLRSWLPGLNLHPPDNTAASTTQMDDLQWELRPIKPTRYYFPESGKPEWELKLEEPLNMSSCNVAGDTWWGAGFLDANATAGIPVSDPSFRLQFDDKSASFQFTGLFRMNTDPGNDVLDNGDPEQDVLVGTVEVDFLGNIDVARSDILEPAAGSLYVDSGHWMAQWDGHH
ncbi:hypothetical protein MFIFM68171_03880 [Madurella fahalii]|uniref:Uncharacterized protein n=1 Tax=Madurella fahalii TaxID=1157608 RepID=A0ABQ0G7E7_9PEZI